MPDKIHTARPNIYDYLKVVALVSMIVDHIGFFFLPEYEFLRVIGRLAFPLFLFLVGYNGSFRRRNSLRIYAIVIQLFVWLLYYLGYSNVYYLNILFVIGISRLILSYTKDNTLILLFLFFVALFGVSFTKDYADYGTLSLSFAILGYRAGKYKYHRSGYIVGGGLVVYYVLFMISNAGFDKFFSPYLIVVGAFLFVAYALLYYYNFPWKISPYVDSIIYKISHNTLHIYFIHLVIFIILYCSKYLF